MLESFKRLSNADNLLQNDQTTSALMFCSIVVVNTESAQVQAVFV